MVNGGTTIDGPVGAAEYQKLTYRFIQNGGSRLLIEGKSKEKSEGQWDKPDGSTEAYIWGNLRCRLHSKNV